MLRSMQDLKNYTIGATDGEIGHVTDLFFDDEAWVIRYLVVDTGTWLMSRKVLISPFSLMEVDWIHKRLPVRISRDQVRNSPDIDTERPVSRQHEMEYSDYYGYPYYWGESGFWGDGLYFPVMAPVGSGLGTVDAAKIAAKQHSRDDPHLRSCKAVLGYHIHARDGDIGHVQGMLVDEDTWALRYLVVETSNWWGRHQVLIAPSWIESISWEDSTVTVNLDRQTIEDSPRFDSTIELNRQHERDLYQHYERSAYWDNEPRREMAKNHDKLDT